MPPRATRSKAPTADASSKPATGVRGNKSAVVPTPTVGADVKSDQEEANEEPAPTPSAKQNKGKGKAKIHQSGEESAEPQPEFSALRNTDIAAHAPEDNTGGDVDGEIEGVVNMIPVQGVPKLTSEERLAKLKELRVRMSDSTSANRKALISDHQKTRTSAQEIARLAKQRKLAETLREKIEDAEDESGAGGGGSGGVGEKGERRKAWGYTLEEQERWAERMEKKKASGEFEFDDQDSNAQRLYIKNLKSIKPDLTAYNRQKEHALGLPAGTLVPLPSSASSSATKLVPTGKRGSSGSSSLTAAENLYRDGKTLAYADSKPSDEAIDRVLGHMNKGYAIAQKAQKKRNRTDEEGDVTYINDANKVFNKKVNRYFDKYTQEIRANFERGTAL